MGDYWFLNDSAEIRRRIDAFKSAVKPPEYDTGMHDPHSCRNGACTGCLPPVEMPEPEPLPDWLAGGAR
jgi:hypothetical protein